MRSYPHHLAGAVVSACAMVIGIALLGSSGVANAQLTPEHCDRPSHQEILEASGIGASRLDARAVWLNRRLLKWPGTEATASFRLYHSAHGQMIASPGRAVAGADGDIVLDVSSGDIPPDAAARFKYLAGGTILALREADLPKLPELHRQQVVLAKLDARGIVLDATAAQSAGALDDLYAAAAKIDDLGVSVSPGNTRFRLWAPSARDVSVCIFATGQSKALQVSRMNRDATSGAWSLSVTADLTGKYYTYLVDVFAPGVGMVRNRVTDPYSVSLTADSRRSYIASLDSAHLKPRDWDRDRSPGRVQAQTDMTIYELHVRDFSINDPSVPEAHRGKYTAFTFAGSHGMKHLKALSAAGMTDVHLLPVFDFATVPETRCLSPVLDPAYNAPDGESQQAAVTAVSDRDCFNWGYDPLHYTAPEGSYATRADDGAQRIVEFRQMVAALHRIGLRVGMDVVYNHTSASGQSEKSVLDRIVPGYYHRLSATGMVERSTCCDNTATEHMMMGKLMVDSVLTWAREYRIDSFRFDLMGHQPRGAMEALKTRLKSETGRDIQLIGEGWNFGEVADGARFVQASQLSLNGSGIGTFSDRARDAVRGGGAADNGERMIVRQGFVNGLGYDRNALADEKSAALELLRSGDLVRAGLAGSLRNYALKTHRDETVPLSRIDYAGQPAGYVSEPGEVVNYVENHDNQTLFDINVLKLPVATSREDRARVQVLALAINAFSQGIAYFHAGGELLRSKSLDRNSFDSGDWFNRIDWTGRDNYFGIGAPMKADNGGDYALLKPLLANAAIKPAPADIAWTRDAFLDLLRIRASTPLFRLRTRDDIVARLTFHNTGAGQIPTVLVGHLAGEGYPGARFRELVYLINVDKTPHTLVVDALRGKAFQLHPVHQGPAAADKRVAHEARFDSAKGAFRLPARTAMVFVVP